MGSHDAQPDVDALLREARWLRGVARALVGAEAAADLAQEVHLAAARGAAPGERGPRRAWLRTVARRIATRRAAREAKRRLIETEAGAERAAASAEPADLAAERVALQKRLAEALARLAPDDRALLVRRHFDGLSASALAAELDVSPAAARQRLVRATDRLRAEFARTDEDWRAWSPALAAAAFGPHGAGAATGAASLSHESPAALRSVTPRSPVRAKAAAAVATSLVPLAIMKKLSLAAAAVLALAAVAWMLVPPPEGASRSSVDEGSRSGLAALDTGVESADPPTSITTEPSRTPSAVIASDPAGIVVLDEAQEPIPGLRGVWIDGITGRTVELHFDAKGRAPRPEGAEGEIAVIGPEHVLARVRVESQTEPSEPILLAAAGRVRGTLTVDGGPPPAEVALLAVYPALWWSEWPLPTEASAVRDVLAGALPSMARAVDANGHFELRDHGMEIRLSLSPNIVVADLLLDGAAVVPPSGGGSIQVEPGVRELLIRANAQPALRARVVQGAAARPYGGGVAMRFTDSEGRQRMSSSRANPASGHVAVPIPTPRGSGRFGAIESVEVLALPDMIEVPIATLDLVPEQRNGGDLGTLVMADATSVEVTVLRRGEHGTEIAENARISFGWEPHPLGPDARAVVEWHPSTELAVLADRCQLRTVPHPGVGSSTLEVVLEPAPVLVVPALVANRTERLLLNLAPEDSSDASALWSMRSGLGHIVAPSRRTPSMFSTSGDRLSRWSVELWPAAELVVSNLFGEIAVRARIEDITGRVLHEEVVPANLESEHVLRPEIDREGLARVRIHVTGEGGTRPSRAWVRLTSERSTDMRHRPVIDGVFEIGPLLPGEVTVALFDYGGSGGTPVAEKLVELRPGPNEVALVMPAAD